MVLCPSQLVFIDFSINRMPANTQDPCSSGNIPTGPFKGGKNFCRFICRRFHRRLPVRILICWNFYRYVLFSNYFFSAQHKRSLNGVLKLSDVARPGIVKEPIQHSIRHALDIFFIAYAEFLAKMINQQRNILHPIPKRRHVDLHDIEPIIQIFPEFTRFYFFFQIQVCGSNQPDRYFPLKPIPRPAQIPFPEAPEAALPAWPE